jgi:hypothetical protein
MHQNKLPERNFFSAIPLLFVSTLVLSLLLVSSCEEPSFVGLEVQPDDDRFRVKSVSNHDIRSTFMTRDSLSASGHPRSLLGILQDPVFGRMDASFMTQVSIMNVVNFGEGPVADSIVLKLFYSPPYGNLQAAQHIEVYEVNQVISPDTTYYSNLDPQEMIYGEQLLGSRTFIQGPQDTIISVHLTDPAFKDKLLFPPDSMVQSVGKFITYMKGLYVTISVAGETGALFPVNLNSAHSKMTLYYHNTQFPDSTLRYDFVINEGANRLNLFRHDHSTAVFHEQLEQPGTIDSVYYIKGASGLMTRLSFENLHTWRDSMPVSINSAMLILPVERGDMTAAGFPLPPRLTLLAADQDGQLYGIIDTALGNNYFGGTLNSDAGEYRLNITNWLQNFILREDRENSLYLNVRDAGAVPNRAVLRGRDHPAGGPRIEIVYTRH